MPESDVGQYFGKYFLLKKLAAGGMGEVFLAKQQGPAGFEKILIIKKVLAHLTENKEFVELFLGEARLAARMNHRNIVQVFELGEQDGAYFIAMEYIQGKSLRDAIDAAIKRKEKIPAELCRTVIEQICDGSSYAHNLTDITGRSLNIVHRDLNPQNVLVSYTGDVKVIDFGIAKSEMSTVKTEAGMIKGKFVYMSPEQSLAKKLDKRSDIFAIGISLYEMLTGINPFHKNNIVLTLEAVQRYDPPPVSEYDPSYAPFDPIIAKSLAKDRDRRYSDAAEMQDDLRRIVVPPSPERLGPWMSRLFRTQLEEEQKLLKDTDSAKLTGSAKVRTPAKPVAAPKEADPPEGATMMLPSAPAKKGAPTPTKPAPAPRPAPKAPAPPPAKKPQGAGDTLMDMEAPVVPGGAAAIIGGEDDNPGATAMLKPGQALPPPPSRKKPIDTMPEGEPPEGATAFLGTAPARPEKPRKAPSAPKESASNGVGGTNIMTPEESQAAQREALAKMQQNQAGGPPPQQQKPRGGTRTGPAPTAGAKKGKGLLFGVIGGGVVLLGIVAWIVISMLGGDDKPAKKKAPPPPPPPVEDKAQNDTPPPAEEKKDTPPPEEKKEAPAGEEKSKKSAKGEKTQPPPPPPEEAKKEEKPAEKAPAPPKPPAEKKESKGAKLFGSLMVNAGPNVAIAFNGTLQPKVAGAQRLGVTAESGKIEVGDPSTAYVVTIEYKVTGKEITAKVNATPWAIVFQDGTSKGKTGTAEVKIVDAMSTVELKKPGQDAGMTVRFRFTPTN